MGGSSVTLKHAALLQLNRLLRRIDLQVDRHSDVNTDLARSRFLEQAAISTVLDIGAHRGAYARTIRDSGFRGTIHSFEPLPDAFRALANAARRDPAWHCNRWALGDRTGTVEFHVAGNEVSSSLRVMTATHVASAPTSAPSGLIEVPIYRLDDALLALGAVTPNHRLAIKIDVQGAENMVLDGAVDTLGSVHLVEVELSLVELYTAQVLFQDQIRRLTDLGFELVWIERGFRDPDTGRLLQMDGIFRRKPG